MNSKPHLIAAAPDLYAALEAFVSAIAIQYKRDGSDVVHVCPGMHVFEPYMQALAALAKARGE